MDPGVRDFIVSTTSNFNKLPIVLKDKIKAGSLNYSDIVDYISTASNIDDYTFKMIAKHVFNNIELANITFEDMLNLADNSINLAIVANISEDPNVVMTPAEMLTYEKQIIKATETDNKLADAFRKYTKVATTVRLETNAGKKSIC